MRYGQNLIDAVTKLPFELHIPGGYQFCGPATKLQKRLQRGDKGINPLDQACKQHDLVYDQSSNLKTRHIADKDLANRAWERVKAKDSTLGEKTAAWFVTNAMKIKTKLGMGSTRRRRRSRRQRKTKLGTGSTRRRRSRPQIPFMKNIFTPVLKEYKKNSGNVPASLRAARYAIRKSGGKKQIKVPRIIPIPKRGGFLPFLIPLFASLSALGGIASGVSGIVKTVNAIKANKELLDETRRHNKALEGLNLGNGIEIKKFKAGMGIYLPKN